MKLKWDIRKKLCFIVQRYGEEICGSAEELCWGYVMRLKQTYNITVLTSCAGNGGAPYRYAAGQNKTDDIRLVRFRGKADLNCQEQQRVALQETDEAGDIKSYIIKYKEEFDLFIFVGHAPYMLMELLPCVADKAVVILAAEGGAVPADFSGAEIPPPRGFVCLTETEEKMVRKKFEKCHVESIVTGVVVDLPSELFIKQADMREKYGLPDDYVIYAGLINDSRNCAELFEALEYFQSQYGGSPQLVLTGETSMDLPAGIMAIGPVDRMDQFALMRGARTFLAPAKTEGPEPEALKAMAMGTPILFNVRNSNLKKLAQKSNAGLYYYQKEDFAEALQYILTHRWEASIMAKHGWEYIRWNYTGTYNISNVPPFFNHIIEENRAMEKI